MSKTRVAAIPAPTDANLRDVARAVKNVLDVREGLIGDPLDANVTFRDLQDGGVIDVTVVGRGGGSGSLVVAPGAGSADTGYNPVTDLTPPPQPTGFTATGAFASVFLAWDAPPESYANHAYTEIWRGAPTYVGETEIPPVIGNAVLIGTTDARVYVDYLGNATKRYYWIRFVSQADIKGPYNATNGTAATTAQNPALLLDSLTTAITTGQLATSLNTRINLIDAADTVPGSVNARVRTVETEKIGYCVIGGAATDHTNKTACVAAGGTWSEGLPLATAVKQVSISDGTTSAALEQRFTAQKTTNDGLLAQYTVKIDVAGHVSGFGLASTLNSDSPFSEFGVRADRFWIAPPSVSSATAPSTNLYKGYVWRDTSVTPNVTRYYTGSGWTTTPQVLPFVVVAGASGTINGVTVGPGVYIDTAFIADATITNAKIGNAAIDDAKIANLSAAKITAGTLDVQRLAANSITADRIKVTSKGGLTIISDDPMFGDSTLWTATANISFLTGDTSTGGKGGTYVASSTGTDRQVTSARRYEIDPNRVYRLSANLYRAASSDRNIYLFVQFYNGAGTYLGNAGWGGSKSGYTFGGVPATSGEWVRSGNSFGAGTARTIPATARFCEIGVWFNYSGNGTTTAEQRCQDLRLDEAINGGQLVVDGSITATQIDSRGLSIKDSAGNVILSAGATVAASTFGGNANGSIDGTPASTIKAAVTNFNASNDRNSAAITAPTIASDGTAVDHVLQTDGSADLSFEWAWSGAEGDIDGFRVYIYQSSSSTAYTFGTTPAAEMVFDVPAAKRAFLVYGVVPDQYYTFGVQAYRSVDKDINANGVITSSLVKPSLAAENPYRPSASVAFAGNLSGTINNLPVTTVTADAANGANAWAKFSGAGSTLPAGNVEFNFATSTSKGGNATNTDAVGTQTAATVQNATVNFNARNDRNSTAVVAPGVANAAGTLDHVINTDGSSDISFEWTWGGTEADIDGFIVYVHDNGTTTPTAQRVIDGAANVSESVYYVTPARRAFILSGAAADHWYTFGVQAYRVVDPDINAAGFLRSSIAQPASGATETTFGAYRPSSNVAFAGNVSGTIDGSPASTVKANADNGASAWAKFSGAGNTLPSGNVEFNFAGSSSKGGNATNTDAVGTQTAATVQTATVNFNNRNDRIATAVVAPVVANSVGTLDHVVNTDGSADLSFEWTWGGTESEIDGFIVFVHDNGTTTPTSQRVIDGAANALESVYYLTPQRRAIILPGVAADHWYTIGVQAYRIVDTDINSSGVLRSAVVQPLTNATETTFGAYRPSSNVAFAGNVTGTIDGSPASTVATGAVDGTTALSAVNNATTGLATKLANNARNALSGSGGLAAGSLQWNSSGVRTSGSGVGLTANGLAAYDAGGNATFALNASNGSATFAGALSAATGSFTGAIYGGSYTSAFAWPSAGTPSNPNNGFHLSSGGLMLGNYNTLYGTSPNQYRKFLLLEADGNLQAPGFSIIDGTATFSGTLTANTVNTTNIVGAAVSSGYATSGASNVTSISVSVVVPTSTSAVVILGYAGVPYIAQGGSGKETYNYTAIPSGTAKVQRTHDANGTAVTESVQTVTTQSQHVITSINGPTPGTYTVTLERDVASGTFNMAVLVNKR